ncbi:MAG: CbtA family protein [Candidatus Puniceispirillales bacterium]
MFSRLLTAALFAGCIAGIIAGLLQLAFVQPVLLHAELYEGGQLVHFGAEPVSAHPALPPFDAVRDLLSIGFSVLVYIGYGLILGAVIGLAVQRGHAVDLPRALLWGLAGFATFHLAPAFSLPPEVPGVASAPIMPRQIWWFGTVIATAAGLWLFAFHQRPVMMVVAAVLILAPHGIGAPEPDSFRGPVPPEIAAHFASRALGVGLVTWLLLGVLMKHFMATEGATGQLQDEQDQ